MLIVVKEFVEVGLNWRCDVGAPPFPLGIRGCNVTGYLWGEGSRD